MLTGGCLCGEVRYETDGEPSARALCHCETCRRAHAAPMVGWFSVPRESFRLVSGEPKSFASSPKVQRLFCPTCGAHVLFEDGRDPSSMEIATTSLDDPESLPPQMHIWATRKLDWVELDDGLPHHVEDSRSPLMYPEAGNPA